MVLFEFGFALTDREILLRMALHLFT